MMKKNSGQVLLIVIITMIVALTAGLSLASRTITNLKLSKQNEDSQRAFQAASAGIDKYINASSGTSSNTLNNANFTTDVKTINGADLFLNNGEKVDQDRGIDVWLSTYPGYTAPLFNGNVTIYWGSSDQTGCGAGSGNSTRPALEVVVISGSLATPTTSKYLFDRCSRIVGTLSSSSAGGAFQGVTYGSQATISGITNGLIMKVIPLYNSSIIGVHGTAVFPAQGKVIQSLGKSGDSQRKIIYYESYPQIPNEVFPYAILSQ